MSDWEALFDDAIGKLHEKDETIAALCAVLCAMKETVYEQPVGCWWGAIDSVLRKVK